MMIFVPKKYLAKSKKLLGKEVRVSAQCRHSILYINLEILTMVPNGIALDAW